jgi:hypothetical protein
VTLKVKKKEEKTMFDQIIGPSKVKGKKPFGGFCFLSFITFPLFRHSCSFFISKQPIMKISVSLETHFFIWERVSTHCICQLFFTKIRVSLVTSFFVRKFESPRRKVFLALSFFILACFYFLFSGALLFLPGVCVQLLTRLQLLLLRVVRSENEK